MDHKAKFSAILNNLAYILAVLILGVWAAMYLYFLSSSQTPPSVYDYGDELNLKEKALERTLINIVRLNPNPSELIKVYEMSARNKLCQSKNTDAEQEVLGILRTADAKLSTDKELMANIYLKTANLRRDFNNLDMAKSNYNHSLDCLKQISFSPDFKNSSLITAAIDFNNLGILYFLTGQKSDNESVRLKNYLTARDYFVRAKYLMYFLDSKNKICFQNYIDENVNLCLLEMQSLH